MQEPGENCWGRISRTGGQRIPPPVQGMGVPEGQRGERRDLEETKFVGLFCFIVIFGCVGSSCSLFSSCGVRGLLSVAVRRLLIVVPSLFSEHGL